MRDALDVDLRTKRWLIAQKPFDPGALDAMEIARPDLRVRESRREQEQLIFSHEEPRQMDTKVTASFEPGVARESARSLC
jgi:hypothetical protein